MIDLAPHTLKEAREASAQGRRADFPHHLAKLTRLAAYASPEQQREVGEVITLLTSPVGDPWAQAARRRALESERIKPAEWRAPRGNAPASSRRLRRPARREIAARQKMRRR